MLFYSLFFLAGCIFSVIIYILYKIESEHFKLNCKPDEIHFIKTKDNIDLSLYRYYNKNKTSKYQPVILCHGFTSNRHNFDNCIKENGSLPHYLKEKGFDVWILELRKRGCGNKPRSFSFKNYNWGFAEYIDYDVKATIDFVKKHTKSKQVNWIGHSMGGMLGYSAIMKNYSINNLVAIASPTNFKYMNTPKILARFFLIFYRIKPVFMGTFMRMVAPFVALARFKKLFRFGNLQNYTYKEKLIYMNSIFSNISRGIVGDFSRGIIKENFIIKKSNINFNENFNKIKKPVFFISGTMDVVVPTQCVQWGHDNISSKEKKMKTFGKEHGHSIDYGHGELVLSKNAYEEIYPDILAWLKKYNK